MPKIPQLNRSAHEKDANMSGKVFGVRLFLDEVVTRRNPPTDKVWETVSKSSWMMGGGRMLVDVDAAGAR